jgi:hypothetical protein
MSYLIPAEFKRFIQVENLNQIINNDQSILIDAILDAQAIARQHLIQKYYINEELADLLEYDITVVYVPNQRIYLDADAYNSLSTYANNSLVSKDNNVYQNKTNAPIGPEAWTVAHWTLLGAQYSMYYVPIPAAPVTAFDYNKIYSVGDQVFWLGSTYTCNIATQQIDHETLLQAYYYQNVPLANIFPDDPVYGVQFWGTGTAVTIAANSFPTGFTSGDNRDRTLVRNLIWLSLYVIFPRISPRQIPQFIESHYKEAMTWLKDASEGNITADIAAIQPRSGGRIRYGSAIKNVNSY